jgi:hypothetical protein
MLSLKAVPARESYRLLRDVRDARDALLEGGPARESYRLLRDVTVRRDMRGVDGHTQIYTWADVLSTRIL